MTTLVNLPIVGRIVWGHPIKERVNKDTGQTSYSFGWAVKKTDAAELNKLIKREASTMYPDKVPQGFSWKLKDGDKDTDANGKPLSEREGYAGAFVYTISSNFPIRTVTKRGGTFVNLTEAEVKTGDYIGLAFNARVHGVTPGIRGAKPGLYINPISANLVASGPAIVSGPDVNSLFGEVSYQNVPELTTEALDSSFVTDDDDVPNKDFVKKILQNDADDNIPF